MMSAGKAPTTAAAAAAASAASSSSAVCNINNGRTEPTHNHNLIVVGGSSRSTSTPPIAAPTTLSATASSIVGPTADGQRLRSNSAYDAAGGSSGGASTPSTPRASSTYLSPDYGSTQSTTACGTTSKRSKQDSMTSSSSKSSPFRRRHHNSGNAATLAASGVRLSRHTGATYLNIGVPSTSGDGTKQDYVIKRSASAILSGADITVDAHTMSTGDRAGAGRSGMHQVGQRPKSSFGSGLHLGSSVTFCNTLGKGPPRPGANLFPIDGDASGLRRSCSITLAYPSESILQLPGSGGTGTGTTGAAEGPTQVGLNGMGSARGTAAADVHGGLGPGGFGRLLLPMITYDGVTTAPTSPTGQTPGGDGTGGTAGFDGDTVSCAGGGFGSTYQLHSVRSKNVLVTPRGSFLTVNQSPSEFRESMLSISYPNCTDDTEEVSLVYTRLEKIPMKDFAAEIRAHLDVEHFLSQAQLMLDMPETNMEEIFDRMLRHLLDNEEQPAAFQEASKVLFTHRSVRQCSKTIQSTCSAYGGGYDYDQSWLCALCTVPSVQKRHVAIARLRNPAYLGRTCQEVWFIILVVTSTKEKGTKNALETGRTFATLFADMDLRLRLLGARTENEFKQLMWEHMKELAEEHSDGNSRRKHSEDSNDEKPDETTPRTSTDQNQSWFARGLRADWKRRMPHYFADYKDGFCGVHTLHKTISTTFFLYFACILPAIAFGVLNANNTNGIIDVKKAIYSQTIGGLVFAVFGGQPMVILLTTAPLALYTKVIYNISEEWKWDFVGMFACTGLWNSFFLLIYAFTDASNLMKWCTRSTEEIFALFISMAFAVDAFKDVICDFHVNYYANCHSPSPTLLYYGVHNSTSVSGPISVSGSDGGGGGSSTGGTVGTSGSDGVADAAARKQNKSTAGECASVVAVGEGCLRQNSLLYLLLMLGTVWLGLSLYNFTKTPFLNASKRELLADCALPVSVLLMSFFGSYVFADVKLHKFEINDVEIFKPAPLSNLDLSAILGAMGLGFCLSLLFFMDQNIAGALVNSSDNRLKKGPAYHWDLMVVALLNAVLAYFGLPMVHGALPHSPLHVRAMADVEDRVCQGHVYLKIVCVRETRVTGILAHVLIGLSVFYIQQLKLIPRPVLDGLFLYLAITALHSNQLFERIMLLVTEQTAYPPNHYIRTVPQRKIHLFTFIQLLQLAVLCGFGFAPTSYLKMVFPVLHLVMLPIRHKLVPHMIERRYLHSLDGH